ncbi:50S ribosomal protein L13 [Buchnera aphidicola]|uniref:Large ribosomal subunit protein uL13 n=1 Tax=Buchnera aphidicola (Sarucallis kahawaluokalani) TaxID=1241878 RepID=A0A4D6YJ94_9GAMM|nr:50S ribosomal protein L13 [Buchnera aphidicola]QCI26054.1 50S ribosomal protein L13 [Buchnera aphidicola (Sarucallis kahawaluokalani)]
MKSPIVNANFVKKNWYYVDAKNQILGRFASKIAHYLRGKHKIEYTPHIDIGDFIIVLNAKDVIVTGNKKIQKIYYRHTGYIGGIKKFSFQDMLLKNPTKVIKIAVKGMLPKGILGNSMLKKLKIYAHNTHNHSAQQPKFLNL